jgi:hypothetical protein
LRSVPVENSDKSTDSGSDVSGFIRRNKEETGFSKPVIADTSASSKTFGERVFDKLVEYPTDFTIKVIGFQQDRFESDIVDIVAKVCRVIAVC